MIPLTSICVTVLLWFSILAGILAMRDSRVCAKTHPDYEASHIIQGRPLTRVISLAAPALVPVVFLFTWLLLMLRQFDGSSGSYHSRRWVVS